MELILDVRVYTSPTFREGHPRERKTNRAGNKYGNTQITRKLRAKSNKLDDHQMVFCRVRDGDLEFDLWVDF